MQFSKNSQKTLLGKPVAPDVAQSPPNRLPRTVHILAWVSLLTDISSEMVYPIVPLFLTQVLRTPMSVVGVIEGIAESTASVLKIGSGWLSDRLTTRRPLIIAGYALSAISKPLLAFAATWHLVLGSRLIDRVGKGIRTSARDALLADAAHPQQRGRAFGFHRAMDTVGAAAGPLLALLLLSLFQNNYRLPFLIALVPALFGVFLIFAIREAPRPRPDVPQRVIQSVTGFDPRFTTILIITILFSIGNSSDVFLILRARDLGLSDRMTVFAYVVYNIVYALTASPAGRLSDRVNRKFLIGGGYLVFSLVYLGFAVASRSVFVWGLFIVYGGYAAMTEGVSKALVADMVPADRRGMAMGLYHTSVGIATLIASTVAGVLWTQFGASAPFLYGAGTAFLAGLMLLIKI